MSHDISPSSKEATQPPAKKPRIKEESEGTSIPSSPEEKDQLITSLRAEIEQFKSNEGKLKHQLTDLRKRESALVLRLSTKEQEIHELQSQVSDLRQTLNTTGLLQARQTLLDPAVNQQFQKMKEELEEAEKKLKHSKEELEAVQFTPQSTTGKKLLSKCRLLQEENEEFGHQLSEERIHKLENDLALQKEIAEELKKSLQESTEFVVQLDEDVDAMHKEIFSLKQQLKVYESKQEDQKQTS